MKTKWTLGMACVGACLFWAQSATAGPSLEVSKPPVQSAALLTGPTIDPAATNGQWFIDGRGSETVRTNEFYDHIGGGTAGANAITGYVDTITYFMGGGIGSPIVGFTIQATIHNDTSPEALWASGSNSHGETLATQDPPYVGPLVDTKLVAEFAIADNAYLPQVFQAPYRDSAPRIEAWNEDQRAWYCWNPDDQNPEHKPAGGYFVPTWDFGTIPLGQSATRQLDFRVAMPGLQPSDSRYMAILNSYNGKIDILQNRTTSLKISTWIDDIALDTGTDQPELPLRHSDVSVFHNQIGAEPELLDFGDAPDPPYPTLLANDGARHAVVPGVYMGLLIDPEADGQPDANATGDDKALLDDEDGVVFLGQLLAGQTATVQVTLSTSGYVYAWADFDADGSWAQSGDNIINGMYFPSGGTYAIAFSVPASALATNTCSRFRFTTQQGVLSYLGQAPDGEVEDHMVDISEEEPGPLDFGDAPDPTYPTLLPNGARHVIVPGVFMGYFVDPEADGQPTANADGDDMNPLLGIDDEDGVTFLTPLYPGNQATVQVVCSVSGFLSAWIDFNADGDWADSGETIFGVQGIPAGTNVLGFAVPGAATIANTYARFRFTTLQTPIGYAGLVANGEVEDYQVAIAQEPAENLDFGDAMDRPTGGGYPTLLINNGARHAIVPGVFLGQLVDAEPDGQPTLNADGDDLNPPPGPDDEDGVTLPALFVAGSVAQVQVSASVPGFLNAWIDWNANGTWVEPGEQVFMNAPLIPGINNLSLPVPIPPALVAGGPHSRWRFTTYAPPAPAFIGAETDGEVEDYEVRLEVLDFGDALDPSYPTLLANDGARHRIPSAYWLGANAPDLEPDGQPTAAADGDDNAGTVPDDEDGVFVGAGQALVQGDATATLGILASTGGVLNAWLDFDGDGNWFGASEWIAHDLAVPAGVSPVPFAIPATARLGPVFGRFRFASAAGLGTTGLAHDGEVEDHVFTIYQRGPDTNAFRITNIVKTATNEMTIWWAGESNVTYQTQYATNLLSDSNVSWTAWGGYVFSPPYLQRDTNAVETTRFYRVVAPWSPPPP